VKTKKLWLETNSNTAYSLTFASPHVVTPAKAGVRFLGGRLDSCLRRNDEGAVASRLSNDAENPFRPLGRSFMAPSKGWQEYAPGRAGGIFLHIN
jgi:hypothetical protein